MSLVLDASMAIAAIHQHETTPRRQDLLRSISRNKAWVPALWHLEVANVLQRNARKGLYPTQLRDLYLAQLSSLPIEVDSSTSLFAWHTTLILAEKHRLSVYDACYLELAIRRSLPLATLDDELQKAAVAEGVTVLTA